jgi:hypothetical protein
VGERRYKEFALRVICDRQELRSGGPHGPSGNENGIARTK